MSQKLPLPAEADDLVAIPRSLIGAACGAISMRRSSPRLLAELRRYTLGDLAGPMAVTKQDTARGGVHGD